MEMIENSNIEGGRLSAIAEEMEALKAQYTGTLAEIGEKALPELRANPEYADLAEKADLAASQIDALEQEETTLRAEIERREQEELELAAKYTCYNCKKVNPVGSKFCEECGANLEEPPVEYCRECGTLNQPGQKFCGECGNKLQG